MIIGVLFHILAAAIWVGGMFFAVQVLRPASGALEPAVRLMLWRRVLGRFLAWVWLAVVVLPVSGYGMVLFGLGGFAHLPLYLNLMQTLGIIMILAFLHLYFAPWRRFCRAVDAADWPAAGVQLNQIRLIVTANLALGLVTLVVGATGRYWG
jgi:uncharacterized membrane protein